MPQRPIPVKCLLVDDLPENLLALAALLEADGVEILQARSGTEALELLLLNDVALALIDVQMPEMDGFELAELMRGSERTRRVPIIFVTAASRDQARVFKGYGTGAVDFLFKPVERHILETKANVFFQLHRQSSLLEEQLEEQKQTLRMHEMFTAVLGHDLRAPLTTVSLSAGLLAKHQDDKVKNVATRLRQSVDWMNGMVQDLLDLTRTRLAGGLLITREACDLAVIARTVLQERASSSLERQTELSDCGNAAGQWDRVRITQVVSNLVGNAFTHGDPSMPITVHVDGTAADSVSISVKNGGMIAAELLPHVFDPFRGSVKKSQRSEGLGLGLYIVEQIVRAHGGEVGVTSDQHSTEFSVILPRA